MWYLKVRWLHDFEDEPVDLYSEVDDDGYEVRKVWVYRDGRTDWADTSRETDEIALSEAPVGSIEEIASEPEFVPEVIDRDMFEAIWIRASALER